MPILNAASVQDLKRLLELYPVASLRDHRPDLEGAKEEICYAFAGERDPEAIAKFLDEYLSCCKQHIYVFEHKTELEALPPIDIPDGERVLESKDDDRIRMLYVIKLRFRVILKDPLEEATLEFLWPVRLDFTAHHLIVRFVVLEKNIGSYFDGRSYYTDRRSLEEKAILQTLQVIFRGRLESADLHKGVKKLWEDDFMDSIRAKYRKDVSTASELMDEDRGIKEHYPDLYATLTDSLLLDTVFLVTPREDFSVTAFIVDPSKGSISFPRFSENKGDTDYVVDEILRHNR